MIRETLQTGKAIEFSEIVNSEIDAAACRSSG